MAANTWELYEHPPSFVIGFHGCRKDVGEAILAGDRSHLTPSRQKWDWLGPGIYFWQGNPQRALEWATEKYEHDAFVLGAILDLGRCLDLLDSSGLMQVRDAFLTLKALYDSVGFDLPENKGGKDKLARILDCQVIKTLHSYREDKKLPPYDSLRAVFPEGDPLYDGAGFRDKNHIQICITPDATHCIKGYFRPIRIE